MILKRIRALQDFELGTTLDAKFFVKGEVAGVRFKNEKECKDLMAGGNFEEVDSSVPENRVIPILRSEDAKPISEEDLSGNLEELGSESEPESE